MQYVAVEIETIMNVDAVQTDLLETIRSGSDKTFYPKIQITTVHCLQQSDLFNDLLHIIPMTQQNSIKYQKVQALEQDLYQV